MNNNKYCASNECCCKNNCSYNRMCQMKQEELGNCPICNEPKNSCARCCNRDCCPCKKKEKITMEAWAGRCGMIFPCGYVKVTKGNDITFLVKAEEGYRIQDIMVDCERITDDCVVIESLEKYALTLHRVTCAHRVDVYFVKR